MRLRNGRGQVIELGPSDARSFSDPRKSDREISNDRHRHNLRGFGLTPADYEALLVAQGGVCAICQRPERVSVGKGRNPRQLRRLAVDHDHATGRVRGLLCQTCNMLVGSFGDNSAVAIAFAQRMSKYLAAA